MNSRSLTPDEVALARGVFGAGLALSLLLVPLRAWQAASFVAPYARANAAVAAIDGASGAAPG